MRLSRVLLEERRTGQAVQELVLAAAAGVVPAATLAAQLLEDLGNRWDPLTEH